jgi:glycosyltransferase involved in cell wall biosynthesis
MKIIQILPELNAGGVERGTLEVGKYLTEQGHESIVISNGGRLVEQLEAEGSRHITLPVHKKHLKSLKQVKVLRRLFEQERPDIIHLRSRVPAWIAWLAWRKMDPQTRPRLVTTVHGFNSGQFLLENNDPRRGRHLRLQQPERTTVLKNYPEVPEDKLTVIHRGVAPSELEYGYQAPEEWQKEWYAAFPETKDRKLLTLPGRITRLKGHEDLLKVIAALKDSNYHGLIVGGAHPKKIEYLDEIKELARTMRVADKITFTGHRSDLPNILSISSIVCSLTQQPESFGRTTLEALALGKPVIGYEHGGVGEILDTLLPAGKIPLGDTEGIVDRVKEWQHHPVKPAQTHPFTLQKMLSQTTELYQTLISSRR